MINRVQQLRRSLKLTQDAFGDRLGVSRDVIHNLEGDRVDLKPYMAKLIAKTFNVSENWLMTGEGSMTDVDAPDPVELLADKYHLTLEARELIQRFAELDPRYQEGVIAYVQSFAAGQLRSQAEALEPPVKLEAVETDELTRAKWHAILDEQIDAQKGEAYAALSAIG